MRRLGTGVLAAAWFQSAVAIVLGAGVVPRVAVGAGWVAALAGLLAIAAGLTAAGGWSEKLPVPFLASPASGALAV